jgi:acetamidase/formamidase
VTILANHHVLSSPQTCQWGFLDAASEPVASIASGDCVTIDTVSGAPGHVPTSGEFLIPPELLEIHRSVRQGPGPHIPTGPVFVEGAEPGDVLEVHILDVKCRQNWGLNISRPLAGALPYDFPEKHVNTISLDLARDVARTTWGLELPLAPFFGIMAVAPPPAWGRVSSIMPRAFGGNLDNKELVAGTILYLPVFVPGALFTCGDGHGAQGDGEVNVNAIETALQGKFRLTVRKDLSFTSPRAETPEFLITMGMDPDLDQCAVMALRDMIDWVSQITGLKKEDAYAFCSIACDMRVTQIVNGCKGIHIMARKAHLDTIKASAAS